MASRFDEDLFCPVCSEVFRDPVILSCSHSFCRDCLQDWWKTKEKQRCPVCGSWSSKGHLLSNITLKKLCESFLQEGLCTLHLQKLKFFCLDHQELVCEVCRDSGRHTNHSFRPVDETAREHRFFLEETPESLGESLRYLQEVQEKFDQTAEHIQVQARLTERWIKEQFLKLHRFLEEEEEARLSALREEEEQKSRRMKEQMEALSRQIADLSDTVRATEDLLRAEDLSFLKNYTPTMLKIFQHSQIEVPQLPSGALIDQAKHLGNLSFNIWTKMKGMVSYCPVILDPNSAHPEVLLSEDLSSVSRGEEQQLPDNPERISHDGSVLGSESFKSGSHSWEVEVGESSDWELGVMEKSIYGERDGRSTSWGVRLSDGLYKTHSSTTGGETVLQVKKHLQKIRVDLDLDSGQLSFSDPDTGSHVHTFKPTFTERVTPFMKTGTEPSLRISPLKVSVTVEQPTRGGEEDDEEGDEEDDEEGDEDHDHNDVQDDDDDDDDYENVKVHVTGHDHNDQDDDDHDDDDDDDYDEEVYDDVAGHDHNDEQDDNADDDHDDDDDDDYDEEVYDDVDVAGHDHEVQDDDCQQ